MISAPKIIERSEKPYMAVRETVTFPFGEVISRSYPEVFGWLAKRGVPPAGAPLIRYNLIDMEHGLEIEIGVPVGQGVAGDDRIRAGVMPAGRYATLTYTGPYTGDGLVKATAALLSWGAEQGLAFKMDGERWGGRFELYETGPEEEPDEKKWQTDLVLLLAD